jgi:peptidoglycan/LPS O-acetylase OafA/YrhL
MQSEKNDQNFPALTGVRAIAAFMVFCHHYTATCSTGIFYSFIKEFYTGVTIFFVLSGFLIYYRYSQAARLDKKFLINYFRNRVARIYPVYFLIVCFSAFALSYDPHKGNPLGQLLPLLFLQLTFIRGFFDTYKFIGVGQGWTLTVEESFYSLFPFFISLVRKAGFIVTLLAVYVVGVLLSVVGAIIKYHGFFYPAEFVMNYTFFGRAAEFFCGMFLAKIVLTKGVQPNLSRWPKFTVLGFAGIVGGLFLMSRISQTQTCSYGTFFLSGTIVNNLILPVYIATFFYGLINEGSLIQQFLKSRLMVLLGKTSYVFYLIHVGVLQFAIEHFLTYNPLIIFILVNIAAIGIYLAVEEPLRKLIRQVRILGV